MFEVSSKSVKVDAVRPQPSAISAQQPFEKMLDDKQAGELLGLAARSVQRLARAGAIPCYRLGKFYRYRATDLDRWVRESYHSFGQPTRVKGK